MIKTPHFSALLKVCIIRIAKVLSRSLFGHYVRLRCEAYHFTVRLNINPVHILQLVLFLIANL